MHDVTPICYGDPVEPDDRDDEVLRALAELVQAIQANEATAREILKRAALLERSRRQGLPYREVVSAEHRPLIVEMLRAAQDRLSKAGSRFRRTEAAALRQEGLTYDQIASLFGVTRQRIIALVQGHDQED